MSFKLLVFTIFIATFEKNHVNCANILCLMSVPSPSHHLWNRVLINELAEQGHNLTVLSADVEKESHSRVHYIHLENVYSQIYSGDDPLSLMDLSSDTNFFRSISTFHAYGERSCEGGLNSKGFHQLLDYPNDFKFDMVIFDFSSGSCLLGFLYKFNYPKLVAVAAFHNPPFSNALIGGHKQTSYVPHFTLLFGSEMNLWQRIQNAFVHNYDGLYRKFVHIPIIDEKMRRGFGSKVPSAGDLEQMTSLMMINTHPSIDLLEPFGPNVIQVAGLQIAKEKPLPEEIKNFLEKSDKKSVLFSLGTNIKSEMMGLEMQKIFIEAFSELPQYNFLWKFDSPEFPFKLPSNLLISKWMPQNDILAHKNVQAFITHSGLLGTHEAIWHSVPMIGIPFLLDQHTNLEKIVRLGIAERINLKDLSVGLLKETLVKVLEDERIQNRMSSVSKRFRDRPESPLSLAVWWIKFVLRNPDMSYMKSPVLKLGYFEANNFDILFLVFGFVISISFVVIKCFSRKADFGKKWKNDKKKN